MFFMIGVAVGAVKFRIAPEASPFRDDVDFDGPGAREKTTFRKIWFLKNIGRKILSEHIFSGTFFPKRKFEIMFRKNGLGLIQNYFSSLQTF